MCREADQPASERLRRPQGPPSGCLRLIGIISAPRRHLVRYVEAFGWARTSRAKLRALVPALAPDIPAHPGWPRAKQPVASRAANCRGMDLLRRTFAVDVLRCDYGGRRSVVVSVADATRARSLLATPGLPVKPATFAPARHPPRSTWPGKALHGRSSYQPRARRHGLVRPCAAQLSAAFHSAAVPRHWPSPRRGSSRRQRDAARPS
jgi:hypothetical protein